MPAGVTTSLCRGRALEPRPAPRLGRGVGVCTDPVARSGARVSGLLWRLSSGDHMVESVTVAPQPREVSGGVYRLADEDRLRSLPLPAGGRRSVFAPDGIMPGTQRGERVLFWPMGIASPGAMRQWGRQPTAFVGRRHFDDPRLVEERFEVEAGCPALRRLWRGGALSHAPVSEKSGAIPLLLRPCQANTYKRNGGAPT